MYPVKVTGNFKALVLDRHESGQTCQIRELSPDSLPQGDVTIAVEYSSLNYKDGLAVTGTGKIIRQFPMVPGIDLAGVVEASESQAFQPGDRVVLTGWGIGERHSGGYTQKARVKGEWLVKLPAGLSTKHAMAIGTAGFTAMLSVMALEHEGLTPGEGEVVVTGAAGGVGSVGVALLAALGHHVTACTGRRETHDYLHTLGASAILGREAFSEVSKKPMEAERWSGAIDSVGGTTLASLLKAMQYGGTVAACGLAGGTDLATTVFPFILRGVNLVGVDSVYCRTPKRIEAWRRLAQDLPAAQLDRITKIIPLAAVEDHSKAILAGQVQGRLVVDVNA